MTPDSTGETIHASAVLLGEAGTLVRGRSGSGKSSLVLALLEAFPDGARLVADDRVLLTPAGGQLLAAVPPVLAGQIEVRGLGILRRDHISPVVLRLVIDLLPPADCPRLPSEEEQIAALSGVRLARLILPEGAADPSRIRLRLSALCTG